MTAILQRELNRLREMVLALGDRVVEAVRQAVRAVETRDAALAQRVIDGDHEIDQMEVDVEEECLKILALHQPVAIDLRFIVSVLKINSDLERIGDKASGIAKKAARLAAEEPVQATVDFQGMAEQVLDMLRRSLGALVDMNRALAVEVCQGDTAINELDDANAARLRDLVARGQGNPRALGLMIELSSALERVADHATNIAEDVIYMVDGTIVRHHPEMTGAPHPRRRRTDQA